MEVVCAEYGYTPAQFSALTMRELSAMMAHMDRRLHNKFASQASLHGIKIPFTRDQSEFDSVQLNPEQEDAMMKAFKDAQQRIKRGRR